MKDKPTTSRITIGIKLSSQLQAGCNTYIAPDGGDWEGCKNQCMEDNSCRYLQSKPTYDDSDLSIYESHVHGCLKYWCAGRHNYHGEWTNSSEITTNY